MFKLMMFSRPFMKFDVENPVHRLYFKTFEETGAWKHCPYQWIIEDDALDVPSYCRAKMNEFYWKGDRAVQKLIAGQAPQRQPKKAEKPIQLRAVG
jgi:hypothetical protein